MDLTKTVWSDFLEPLSDTEKVEHPSMKECDWVWLEQLCEFADEDCSSEVDDSFESITLGIKLYYCSFTLTLQKSEDFPKTPPKWDCTLSAAFEYEWKEDHTLKMLYYSYLDFCYKIDITLEECYKVSFPFSIQKWELDKDDPECIRVTILRNDGRSKPYTLFLSVDWSRPNVFPRSVLASNQRRLNGLKFINWDASDSFADNLRRVFSR